MEAIDRGKGITDSERYLARLADATFLDLWSYPNTFNDRQINKSAAGKELCDLLVVCGEDVIIFSDKSIGWPSGDDVHLCWSRWFRRAVSKSVDQIRGAERWLRAHPDRIFIDAQCEQRLPIDMPAPEHMRVHGIAIALGAQEACSKYFEDADGSLMVMSDLIGPAHTDPSVMGYSPFMFGDVDPQGPFVHVFDETALDLVIFEMDTISDFVNYLVAREAAIRSRLIRWAPSEAEMLAAYLLTDLGDGEHGFPTAESIGGQTGDSVNISHGQYQLYRASEECRLKTEANEISYAWDRLIQSFSGNLLAGTSVSVAGMVPEISLAERALRTMALEDRTSRRVLSEAFLGAFDEAERRGRDRFARVIVPGEGGTHDPECGYVFLILAYRELWIRAKGYDYYREGRAATLRAYCEVALYDHRNFKRMLGIAVDASERVTGVKGGSEDLMLVEILEWTQEKEQEIERLRKGAEILVPGRLRRSKIGSAEYPPSSSGPNERGNRHERRTARSKARKKGL